MARDWSEVEVEAVVTDYFDMLLKELRGENYSKTEHRRALMRILDDRSPSSVEFKHQNISAVLIGLGYPYIDGYKPAWNYQHLLADAVRARLDTNPEIERVVAATVEEAAGPLAANDILSRLTSAPERPRHKAERAPQAEAAGRGIRPTVNYLEREARNRSLGRMGEEFALAFEKARLLDAGCVRLSRQVEHVAVTRGDGLGFDILSFEPDSSDRCIEVKTTSFGIETPFFVTRNELAVSQTKDPIYHLYRVFTYRRDPRMYILHGDLSRTCKLSPIQYLASVTRLGD